MAHNIDHNLISVSLSAHANAQFADIVGFTAWSSSREPTQVFTLLQAVYQEFDKAARKRRVFKVETIGDSCKSSLTRQCYD